MQDIQDPTAWTSILLGMAALAAGIGALRQPNMWRVMIGEIEASPTLQFVCGMLELLVGTLVYLANPWLPHDVLTCVMKALGGLMMLEALAILAACDIYSQLWLRSLGNFHKGWASITILLGLGLSILGLARFP
jgi:uncharacterized protein YjeT (DUF2065 family)